MNLKEYNMALAETEFERIEDALAAMMESKRANPFSIMYLYPVNEAEYAKWEEAHGCVTTYAAYTNAPIIYRMVDEVYDDLSKDPVKELEMVSDEKAYIAKLVERIKNDYSVTDNQGWSLSELGMDDIFGDVYEIYLFIDSSDWDTVKKLVNEFNRSFINDGFAASLTLDDGLMMVGGQFKARPVEGGFFEKKKIKKLNSQHAAAFSSFLDSLNKYLRKL